MMLAIKMCITVFINLIGLQVEEIWFHLNDVKSLLP